MRVSLGFFPSVTCIERVAQLFSSQSGTCFLYSGADHEASKTSYLYAFPFEVIEVWGQTTFLNHKRVGEKDPWSLLQTLIGQERWVGYFGYEMGCYADSDVHFPSELGVMPDAYFQRSALILAYDHATFELVLEVDFEHLPSTFQEPVETIAEELAALAPGDSVDVYLEKIKAIKDEILAGNAYQVCLSHTFTYRGRCDPFRVFWELAEKNPAPFSAYLKIGDHAIVSSSPERLLRLQDGVLESRPIKGTMPRGTTDSVDRENRQKLALSEKERAELTMITDLVRNDLGRVSRLGSVQVKELWRLEEYTNVFHLISVIEGEARPDLHPVQMMRAVFPGGSITGCPKLSAMEVIQRLEKRRRGIYTGSIGHFIGPDSFDFNIAIRTMLCGPSTISCQLGGAITIESDPKDEYMETLHKGQTIFEVIAC